MDHVDRRAKNRSHLRPNVVEFSGTFTCDSTTSSCTRKNLSYGNSKIQSGIPEVYLFELLAFSMMMSHPRSLARRPIERCADMITKVFKRNKSVSESARTVSSSSSTTMATVGKGALPDTFAATARSSPISLERQEHPASASDETQMQGHVITGAATAKQLPSSTISAPIPCEDKSRTITLQNMSDNQLVPFLNPRRVAVSTGESLTANGPATIGTVPTPQDAPTITDGPPTSSTSEAFRISAQPAGISAQPANFAQGLTRIPQRNDINIEPAITRTPDAAITQPPSAALQIVQPIRSPADPALVAAEPTPSGLPWCLKHAPKWNDAVLKWKEEDPKGYLELETNTAGMIKSPSGETDFLSQYQPASKSSKQIKARVKRLQPTLAAFRGIGMSIAAIDPHKIAPIICASVFFGVDVSNSFSVRIRWVRLIKADSLQ